MPGIGVFTLKRKAAYIDSQNKEIAPPKYLIDFEPIAKSDQSSINALNKYTTLSQENWIAYTTLLKENLLSNKRAKIEGIGTLEVDTHSGQLLFNADEQTEKWQVVSLVPIPLKWLASTGLFVRSFNLKLVNIPHLRWVTALPLVITTLAAVGLTYHYCKSPFNKLNEQLYPIITNDTLKKPGLISDTTKYFETADTTFDISSDSLINQFDHQNTDIKTEGIKNKDIEITNVRRTEDGYYIKKCVIITGAYRDTRYKNLMKAKLKAKGLKVFESKIGDLTRIGFEFECHELDLPKYLDSIRNTIIKDAWYLNLAVKEG